MAHKTNRKGGRGRRRRELRDSEGRYHHDVLVQIVMLSRQQTSSWMMILKGTRRCVFRIESEEELKKNVNERPWFLLEVISW